MSVIAERPGVVMWSARGLLFVMMEITPMEMKRILEESPDIEGVPMYYSIQDDDVTWWPACREGEPRLGYDR